MEFFFSPRNVVLFGATGKENKSGYRVLRNIMNYARREDIYLIHPREDSICGIQCYKRIDDLPVRDIDLALVILPVEHVLGAVEDCVRFGVKGVIVESGALYVKGEDDELNEKRVLKIREKTGKNNGTRVMGPNSIGLYCGGRERNDLITSLIYFDRLPRLREKNLSIISQTGLTLSGLLQSQNYIQEMGIAKIAAIGNKFDVDESDLLDFLERDGDTHAIGLYLEDVSDGRRFREQCARIAAKKPVILLKSGKTEKGKRAAVSHTGSLAGDYRIVEALSRQIGMVTVEDFTELFTVARMVLSQPVPRGNRLAVVSISGAGAILSCDLAEKHGLDLPPLSLEQKDRMREIFPRFAWDDIDNPLDIWSSVEYAGPAKAYGTAGRILLEEKGRFDALVYLLTGIQETEFDWTILRDLNRESGVPVYIGFLSGDKKLLLRWREILEEKLNIPTFESLTQLYKSISMIMALNKARGGG